MGNFNAIHEPRSFAFGPFLLMPERQLLEYGGTAIRVGSRALELLTALVEQPGHLITKRELMERVWPDTYVDEGSLKVTMTGLRRALGDDANAAQYIATVIGRGYRFIAQVRRSGAGENSSSQEMTDLDSRDAALAIPWAQDRMRPLTAMGTVASDQPGQSPASVVDGICELLKSLNVAGQVVERLLAQAESA